MNADQDPPVPSPVGGSVAEHKLITILFADVVGSTGMGGSIDAETLRLVLDRCLRLMSQAVDQFGGTVARLSGDGLLAFFGAPLAHEDDPERAVLAALAIHRSIADYSRELGDQPLSVRVGINSGRVVMGVVGGELQSEYTAMGQPIHLAARLQSAAEPGTSLLGETTTRLVAHRFSLEPMGPLSLKGFDEPQPAYRVIAELAEPETRRGLEAGSSSPLVGRDRELAELSERLDGLSDGRGAIVALVGEPGIGKSRLLREARRSHESLSTRWAEGRAYSYSQNQPLSVIRDLVAELLGLSTSDTPAMLDLKLERGLAPLFDGGLEDVWPFVARLVGAPRPPEAPARLEALSAEELNRRMARAFTQTIEAVASRQPLVLSFDDLHWSDPTSLDWIQQLLLSTEQQSLLIVLIFRPDRAGRVWDLKTTAERDYGHRYQELWLKPLTKDESDQLLEDLLAQPPAADLLQVIHSRAEGNPFFIEELVRDARERTDPQAGETSRPQDSLRVPATLQEVVQARLDRLPKDERATLQAASVLGRRFSLDLLQALAAADGELSHHLLQLQRADLIWERARQPQAEYAFRHAIVQEVTYHSLLSDQRKALHHQAGLALEQAHPDRLGEFAGMIAHHYLQAGELEQTLPYARLAGETASAVFANHEAAEHYRRAVLAAVQLSRPSSELVDLSLRAGRAAELASDYELAQTLYAELEKLGQADSDERMLLAASIARATLLVTPTRYFNPESALEPLEEALAMSRRLENGEAEAKVLWLLSLQRRHTMPDERAVEYGEHSLTLARQLGLTEQLGFTLTDLFWAYASLFRLDEAQQAVEQALATWQSLGNLPMLSDSLSSSVFLRFLLGDYAGAIEASQQALEISLRSENLWGQSFSGLYVGPAYCEIGEFGAGIAEMRRSLELGDRAGFGVPRALLPGILSHVLADLGLLDQAQGLADEFANDGYELAPFAQVIRNSMLASLRVHQGKFEQAQQHLDEAESLAGSHATFDYGFPIWITQGRLLLATAEYRSTLELARDARSRLEKIGVRPYAQDAYWLEAEALAALGESEQAAETIAAALRDAADVGSRRLCWRFYHRLSTLAEASGDKEATAQARAQGRKEVEFLAERMFEPDLAAAFLNLPEVQQLRAD